jgi:hypothetical protein
VQRELVTARSERLDRRGIQLAVQRLEAERGVQAEGVELVQQPREHRGRRRVTAERALVRPQAALEVGRLAEVVEGQRQRAWLVGHRVSGAPAARGSGGRGDWVA